MQSVYWNIELPVNEVLGKKRAESVLGKFSRGYVCAEICL